jgi:hypothetical protein
MSKLCPALLFLVVLCDGLSADDAQPKSLDRWVKYYKEVAGGYDIRLKSAPNQPLVVSKEPILVYSNPSIGLDTHGAFFVWTRNGRAEAVAAIWSKRIADDPERRKNVNHEFHSLATEPLVTKGADGVEWTPEGPGLEFHAVPDAPIPAKGRPQRLAQMREISRRFTGLDLNPEVGGSGVEVERRMRILSSPLYRYAEPVAAVAGKAEVAPPMTDGALFGFFFDWDPEILLVVETRPTAEGPRWFYAVAYVDYKPLRLQLDGKQVWEKAEKSFGAQTHKYFCVIGVTTKPVEME